ncbi:MAG: hypothetical protein EKK31_15345 [Hyphomicrobiales bacterium]|nr:MAG: hypothetical protein EKK31_15345 [Hyphomicrobiales bacterium]
MAVRLMAAAIAVTTFVIVGFFVIVALHGPADGVVAKDSPASAKSLSSSTTTHRIGGFTVTTVTTLRSGEAEIELSINDERGKAVLSRNAPSVVLQMSGMESTPVELQRNSSGFWHGSGRPSMSGRWSFVVTIEGEQISIPVDVP